MFQLIQTLSAVDKDDSYNGHQFSFSLAPEAASSSNFTLQDNRGEFLGRLFFIILSLLSVFRWRSNACFVFPDNTAGIFTRKTRYNRHETSTYFLPVVISDNDYPIQSSTETVTIRVCACDHRGKMLSCNAEALIHPTGLSTGALIAILLCIIILLGK